MFSFWVFLFAFRVVKEEIVDESTVLPVFNGRVISWVCVDKSISISCQLIELSEKCVYSLFIRLNLCCSL